ncbi:MAG: ribosome-associated translation inhibitor RaiA [Oscillospiraceae bacterium]
MKIVLTSRKTTIQNDFKERLENKISKLDRFFDEQAVANVTVTHGNNDRETVEITINYNGIVFRSEETTDDRAKSLEFVVDSLIRQIRRNKTRLQKRLKSTAFEPLEGGKEEEEVEQDEYKIVKAKIFPVKPMAVEEAILQMNMLGHEFFMFKNCENDQINVVYCRKNGNYGLIEPEVE